MNNYESIIEQISIAIKDRKNIYLSSHINPDGDSIGSVMALGLALEQLGKNVKFIKTDNIPETFKFLPHIDRFTEYHNINPEVLFILDSSSKDRIGEYEKYIEKSDTVINIDHHMDNNNFGDINLINPNSASTGEIVFNVIEGLGIKLNKEIASYLYTAITMDTGRFMYDKVDENTHEIISKLLRTGINKDVININLYQNRSMAATKLFIKGISTLKTYGDEKIATVRVTQKFVKETNGNIDETDGLISFIRDIDTVEVACLLKEVDNKKIKISLRSKNYINVSTICNKFNGGGHEKAAGCTIYEDIDTAQKLVIDEIINTMRKIDERDN